MLVITRFVQCNSIIERKSGQLWTGVFLIAQGMWSDTLIILDTFSLMRTFNFSTSSLYDNWTWIASRFENSIKESNFFSCLTSRCFFIRLFPVSFLMTFRHMFSLCHVLFVNVSYQNSLYFYFFFFFFNGGDWLFCQLSDWNTAENFWFLVDWV